MTHVRFNNRNCMPARSFYPEAGSLMNWFWNDLGSDYNTRQVPMANIIEAADVFRIELAVPGFSKNDFRIRLDGRILNISGESKEQVDRENEHYVRHEFGHKVFSRNFRLSDWVDSGSIAAKYDNGILQVTIPKVEAAKAKPSQEIAVD